MSNLYPLYVSSMAVGLSNPVGPLQVQMNGNSNVLVVSSNAYVGVGLSNPQCQLDVAGNVNIAGNIGGASNLGMYRNRIINGDMRLDQTLAGSNGAVCGSMTALAASTSNALDKWQATTGPASGSIVAQQVTLSAADQVATGGAFNKAAILSQVPMSGLIAYIPFNNWSANDLIGTTFGSPTVYGSAYSSSIVNVGNTSLDLSGNTAGASSPANYVTYSSTTLGAMSAFSVSFWMYVVSLPSNLGAVVNLGNWSTNSAFYDIIMNSSGNIYTDVQVNSSTNLNTGFAGSVATGKWIHMCGTVAMNTAGGNILYMNGAVIATANTVGYQSININGLWIGRRSDANFGFKGYVNDLRIYNRALSAAEVAALAGNVGIPQAPSQGFVQPMDYSTRLTFDSTTVDAIGVLAAPTTVGTITYNTSIQQIGTACLDCTANPATGGTAVTYLYYPYVNSTSTPFSLSFWIYPTGNSANGMFLATLTPGSMTSTYGLEITLYSGQISFGYSGVGQGFTSSALVNYNAWNHVVAYIGTATNCYINGVAAGSGLFSAYSFANLSIGGGHAGAYSYKGYIDDFRIYNRVLVAAEIALLAGNISVPPTLTTTNLTTQLTFDSTTSDAQGNLGALTLTGTIAYNSSLAKVGSACLDLMANVASTNGSPNSGTLNIGLTYALPTPPSLPFTVSLWVYTPATSGLNQLFFVMTTATQVPFQFYIDTNGALNVSFTLSASYSITGGTVLLNTWNHCVVTVSNTYAYLYMNGVLSNFVATGAGVLTPSPTQICIGHQLSSWRYKGYVDDLRIYNTVLNPAQVLALSGRQTLTTQLTFDNTAADAIAIGTVSGPSATGTIVYSPACKVGVTSLDLTANSAGANSSGSTAYLKYSTTLCALPLTFSCWLYPLTVSAIMVPFALGGPNDNDWAFNLVINASGNIYTDLAIGTIGSSATSYGISASSASAISANRWTHVAVTMNTQTQQQILYVNGIQTASSSLPLSGVIVSNQNPYRAVSQMRVGTRGDNNYNAYQGLIDDLRIYSVALNPVQIVGLYYSGNNAGYVLYQQPIEGQNIMDLGWGTSAAQPVTLSAWLKNSSLTTSNAQALTLSINNSTPLTSWFTFENGSATDLIGTMTGPIVYGTLSSMLSSSTYKVGSTALSLTANTTNGPTNTYLAYQCGSLNIPFSVSFWFYAPTVGVNYQFLAGYSQSITVNNYVLYFFLGTGGLYSEFRFNGSGYTSVNASTTISANTWYHVCGTFSSSSHILYVNGVAAGSVATPNSTYLTAITSGATASCFKFGGADNTTASGSFSGYLDDYRVYSSVLTPAQILQLYQNNASTTTLTPYLTPRSVLYQTPALPVNTWTRVGFTIPGDVAGTWAQDNTTGLNLAVCLGAGSNYSSANVAAASGNAATVWNGTVLYTAANTQLFGQSNAFLGNLGNSLLLTGVQLEKGTVTTPYEFRPYAVENTLSTTVMNNGLAQRTVVGPGISLGTLLVPYIYGAGSMAFTTNYFTVPAHGEKLFYDRTIPIPLPPLCNSMVTIDFWGPAPASFAGLMLDPYDGTSGTYCTATSANVGQNTIYRYYYNTIAGTAFDNATQRGPWMMFSAYTGYNVYYWTCSIKFFMPATLLGSSNWVQGFYVGQVDGTYVESNSYGSRFTGVSSWYRGGASTPFNTTGFRLLLGAYGTSTNITAQYRITVQP